MSLLDTASADLAAILQDTTSTGFSLSMTVTNPDGESASVKGVAADIGQEMDPETGQLVTGRSVHATLPLAGLAAVGTPIGVTNTSGKPWLVELQLPHDAAAKTYKVSRTMPDKLGCIVCFLTEYA